jgi:hypothetical protein
MLRKTTMFGMKVWLCLLGGFGLAACAVVPVTPLLPPDLGNVPVVAPVATSAASVAVALTGPTATPLSAQGRGDAGIIATLAAYQAATGDDPTGSKTAAFTTLDDFSNPHGPYSRSWWFADDGRADISEVLAVILYTEGNTSWDVREAVAARFLWYCGGLGSACQGPALINFLSYFQPWREPWVAPGFTSDNAAQYKSFAQDLVNQRAGLLTAMIPGADAYVHSNDGLSLAGPVDWSHTRFHFANVDPTWDTFLRTQLHRLPNGPARLWVLTMGEAGRVCGSQFVCADMTQPRQ